MNRDEYKRKLLLLFYKAQNFHPLAEVFNTRKAEGWTFEIVNEKRGRCYRAEKRITIPLWSINHKNPEHQVYYLAHELAHIDTDACGPAHGPEWKAEFKRLCPKHLVKFDLNYRV